MTTPARGAAAALLCLCLGSIATPGAAHARGEPTPAPVVTPVVTPAVTSTQRTPAGVATHAGRAVNRDRPRVALRWATPAAARRMIDLRSQGFRWERPERCRRHDGAWSCLTPMSTRIDPVPHQVANLVVRRAGGRLRVVAVSGLD